MSTDTDRRIERLERDLRCLREQTAVRIGPVASSVAVGIYIIGGQSLGTFNTITTYGIVKFSGVLSGITTQTYDPGTVNSTNGVETGGPSPAITAWPNGLGYGTMFNGSTYERVMVVNDNQGTMATALIGGASDDTTYAVTTNRMCRMQSSRIVSVSLADGTSISAYSPDLG